ncbi:adenylate/guanylate cyclase domain-containing protein [Mesorhizobium sp. M0166]|uniref:adenylate/guanylate cyclase domain-containing protein n=1 Tax=unclassified Mesorhizobium TaxID=325217 RepID=UPI003334CBBE
MNAGDSNLQRRLTAILAADMVGYSSLMARDEERTFALVKHLMQDEIEPRITQHRGRVVRTTGDGMLAEFPSAFGAVQSAVEVQELLVGQSSGKASQEIFLRIGINFGDIIVDTDGDVFGDTVNIAARLEQFASPGGICLSGKVHDEVRDKIHLPFEYCGEQHLKNIPRPISVYSLFQKPKGLPPASTAQVAGPSKPSILVRPFKSAGDVQPYFSGGFTEDIVTELTRFTQLTVASHYTSTRLKDVDLVADNGVDFVIEGGIRRMGRRMRITCELVDATSGECLWAERYDGDEQDIFDVQDELIGKIVGTVIGRLTAAGAEKARRKPPANLAAYECVLRGNALPLGDIAAEMEARQWYQRAIELDPSYGRAYAKLAHYKQLEWFRDMGPSDAVLAEAYDIAKKAVALSPNDPVCLNILGWVLLHRRDFDVASQLYTRALELNPHDPEQVSYQGTYQTFAGEPQSALDWFERARVLDPLYEPSWYWPFRGLAHFIAHRPDKAVVDLGRSSTMPTWVKVYLAAANALLGRSQEAKSYTLLVLRGAPEFSGRRFATKEPYKLDGDRNTLLNGMREAGLPE